VQIFLRDLARSNPFKESPGPTAPRVRFLPNAAKAGLRGQRDHDYPKLLERRELFLQEDLHLLGDTGKFIPHLLGAYTLSESSFWVHADEWRRLSTVETRHLLALRVLDGKVGRGRVRAVLRGFGVKTAEIRRSLRQLLADWARISVLPRGISRAEIYPLQRMLRSMEEEKIATALDEYSLGLDASLLTQFSRAEFHVLAQAADLLRLPCAQLFLSLENQLGEHNV
jgi:hypothetical protein